MLLSATKVTQRLPLNTLPDPCGWRERSITCPIQVFLDNPGIKSAEENRDFVMKGMEQVLQILGELAEGEELGIVQLQSKSQDHHSSPLVSDTKEDEDEADKLTDTVSESDDKLCPWYQSQAQAQSVVDTNLATTFQNFEVSDCDQFLASCNLVSNSAYWLHYRTFCRLFLLHCHLLVNDQTLLDMASRSGLAAEASQQLKQYFEKIADIGAQLAALKSTRCRKHLPSCTATHM